MHQDFFRGDIFNGITDVTQGQVSLTNCNADDEHNQQAYHYSNRNQILFQRVEIVKMKIDGEARQQDIVLVFPCSVAVPEEAIIR